MMVGEGVGRGAVERKLVERRIAAAGEADAADHEADLVDDRIGQDAPHVVFQQRVDDPVEDHVEADPDQQFHARKAADQHQYRDLRREGREENHAAPGGFRIGVGQPGREGRRAGVDQEAGQDQPGARTVEAEDVLDRLAAEGDGLCGDNIVGDPCHQDHAAEQVDRGIAQAGGTGAGRRRRPDHQCRADRHDLPENEDRDNVAGEGDAERRAGVAIGSRQLRRPVLRQGEQPAGERHDRKNRAEQPGQPVAAHQLEVERAGLQVRAREHPGEIEQMQPEMHAVGDLPDPPQRHQGARRRSALAACAARPAAAAGRRRSGSGRREATHRHSSCPAA